MMKVGKSILAIAVAILLNLILGSIFGFSLGKLIFVGLFTLIFTFFTWLSAHLTHREDVADHERHNWLLVWKFSKQVLPLALVLGLFSGSLFQYYLFFVSIVGASMVYILSNEGGAQLSETLKEN